MKYYRDSEGSVYAYAKDGSQDDLIKEGIQNGLVLLTDEEAYAHENPRTPEQIDAYLKAQEAIVFLVRTDYKMTSDYFAELSEEDQEQLVQNRKDAREVVRGSELS